MRSLAAEGRAVLVSSHLRSELQDTAGHLVVIGRGRLVADTSVADLLAMVARGRVTLRTTARSEAMTVLARAGAAVAATDRDTLTVCGLAAERVVALLGENAVPFSEVAAHRARLVTSLTELRVVTGTGALLAVAAVLAVAIGTMLRRSAAAVAAVIVAIILPYVLATASPLPGGVSDWLLRLTPAAAFAVQQSQPQYPQVISGYPPLFGYYPLPAWAGFAVLCAYAALALGLAAFLLRRRDA